MSPAMLPDLCSGCRPKSLAGLGGTFRNPGLIPIRPFCFPNSARTVGVFFEIFNIIIFYFHFGFLNLCRFCINLLRVCSPILPIIITGVCPINAYHVRPLCHFSLPFPGEMRVFFQFFPRAAWLLEPFFVEALGFGRGFEGIKDENECLAEAKKLPLNKLALQRWRRGPNDKCHKSF